MAAVDPVFRPEFREALTGLGRAIGNIRRQAGPDATFPRGRRGGRVLYRGAVTTGDFDFVTPLQDELFRELEKVGSG